MSEAFWFCIALMGFMLAGLWMTLRFVDGGGDDRED